MPIQQCYQEPTLEEQENLQEITEGLAVVVSGTVEEKLAFTALQPFRR
jgi:hypothetical protein